MLTANLIRNFKQKGRINKKKCYRTEYCMISLFIEKKICNCMKRVDLPISLFYNIINMIMPQKLFIGGCLPCQQNVEVSKLQSLLCEL